MSPVKYEMGFYIPEYASLLSHSRENLKSYKVMHVQIFVKNTVNASN
jgi:hypothetical protein